MSTSGLAFVSGASGAIGRTISNQLIEDNWDVVGQYHNHPDRVPDRCDAVELDLSVPRTLSDQLSGTFEHYSSTGFDLVIHSAGQVLNRTVINMTPDEWSRVRTVHLDAGFELARLFKSKMSGSKGQPSTFLFISSLVGFQGGYGQSNYAASKAGLVGLAHSLAREWAPSTNVNVIRPPLTKSDMTETIPDERLAQVMEPILTDGMAAPKQTADLVQYAINSPELTGQVLSADNRIHGPWT